MSDKTPVSSFPLNSTALEVSDAYRPPCDWGTREASAMVQQDLEAVGFPVMNSGLSVIDRQTRYLVYLLELVHEQGNLADPANADQDRVAQDGNETERTDLIQIRDQQLQQLPGVNTSTVDPAARQNVFFSGIIICYMEAHSMRRIDEAGSLQSRLYPKLTREGVPVGNIQQWFAEPTQAPESQITRFLEPRLAEMVTYLLHQMRGDPGRTPPMSAFV